MDTVACPNCGEENPAKFRLCGYCGSALVPALPTQELRKTVTIVFSDLKGSTALGEQIDPEALHEIKNHYFDAMAAVIAEHGGKIEKYIGDAIMSVFGLPKVREDDALRAVRAAHGMQQALARINVDLERRYGITLANRTGVNTGEVVATGDSTADQRLADGDAVNVAARLEQAAPAQEILIGDVTYRLVRDHVVVEEVEPLTLKGKSEPVPAYRLVSMRVGATAGRTAADRPLIGRTVELETLAAVFETETPGWASHASSPSSSGDLARWPRPCAADACRTARASRSGRWPRWQGRLPGSKTTIRPRQPATRSSASCPRIWRIVATLRIGLRRWSA